MLCNFSVPGVVSSIWEYTEEEVVSPPSFEERMPLEWKKVDMICFYTWPDLCSVCTVPDTWLMPSSEWVNAWTCNECCALPKVIYVCSQGATVQTPRWGAGKVCLAGVRCVGKAIGLQSVGIDLGKPSGRDDKSCLKWYQLVWSGKDYVKRDELCFSIPWGTPSFGPTSYVFSFIPFIVGVIYLPMWLTFCSEEDKAQRRPFL